MKKKGKHNIYRILNDKKQVLAIVGKQASIKTPNLSSKITIVASTTNYSEYKKSEDLYIKRITELFD